MKQFEGVAVAAFAEVIRSSAAELHVSASTLAEALTAIAGWAETYVNDWSVKSIVVLESQIVGEVWVAVFCSREGR